MTIRSGFIRQLTHFVGFDGYEDHEVCSRIGTDAHLSDRWFKHYFMHQVYICNSILTSCFPSSVFVCLLILQFVTKRFQPVGKTYVLFAFHRVIDFFYWHKLRFRGKFLSNFDFNFKKITEKNICSNLLFVRQISLFLGI